MGIRICVICKKEECKDTCFCKKCLKENKEKISNLKNEITKLVNKINKEDDKEKLFNYIYELRTLYRKEPLTKNIFIEYIPESKVKKISKYVVNYYSDTGKEFREWVNKKDGIKN